MDKIQLEIKLFIGLIILSELKPTVKKRILAKLDIIKLELYNKGNYAHN